MGDWPVTKPLATQDSITQKNVDTSMPRAGFELTIPVFKRVKTVHALDCTVTGISQYQDSVMEIKHTLQDCA
jgi:hypothetical protein